MSSNPKMTHNKIVGEHNKNRIVEVIRKNGPVSRADVSRILNMSKPSVSSNVKELLETGIIQEIGLKTSGVGRRSTLLQFNSDKAYVVGVDIGNYKIRVGLSNLSGHILCIREVENYTGIHGEEVIKKIDEEIGSIIKDCNIMAEHLLVISIGLPGINDTIRKKNMLTPFIKDWEDIDIRQYFTSKYRSMVILENNVNIAAVGETWKGADRFRDLSCIIYVNFGIGIGAGIILNNNLFSGKNNSAGEISFCCFKNLPQQNRLENSGAFEKVISTKHILQKYKSLKNGTDSPTNSTNSISAIFDRYDQGENEAVEVIGEVLEQILMLLINLSAVLNPDVIIFGGGMGERLHHYFSYFHDGLLRNVPFPPEIMRAQCGVLSGVYGAVAVAIREVNSDYRNLKI